MKIANLLIYTLMGISGSYQVRLSPSRWLPLCGPYPLAPLGKILKNGRWLGRPSAQSLSQAQHLGCEWI